MEAAVLARVVLQLTGAVLEAATTARRAAELLETSRGRDLTPAEVAEVKAYARTARGRLDDTIADMEADGA